MRKVTEDELSGSDTETLTGPPTFRMAAKAVLTCRPNSHPFQERTLILDQPAKIGRSVARARPSGNNAIFDCKVLSRNHALLWYENGKFFLQDTKSSNGTFVNNQRLSKSSEESAPREVCSGDIVQFGVDVMEVNKKLTHGCIVATLQLYLPDGKEAKASSSTALSDKASNTPLQDIYHLNNVMKEAMQKEVLIDHKLAAVSKLLMATHESVTSNWKVMIEEDRLLTRIDILERQLETSHKSMTDEKLREEVTQLYADKEKYQAVAKEALRKATQDKIDISKRCMELEKNIQNYLKEKEVYKELSEQRSEELKELADKYEKTEVKSQQLEEEITSLTGKYKEELDELNKKLKEGEDLLSEKQKVVDALISKMDEKTARSILTAHNDKSKVILPENDSNKLSDGDEVIDENISNKLAIENEGTANNRMISASDVVDIDILEKQLENSPKVNEEKLMEEVSQIYADKEKYQTVAKEALRKYMQDKMDISKRCLELERNTQNYLKEKELYKDLSDQRLSELRDLTEKYEKSEIQSKHFKEELATQTAKYKEKLDELNKKLKESEDHLLERQRLVEDLMLRLEAKSLLTAKDSTNQTALPNHERGFVGDGLDRKERRVKDERLHRNIGEGEAQNSTMTGSDVLDLKERLLSMEEELAMYKHRYSECSAECDKLTRECNDLRSEQQKFGAGPAKMLQLQYIIPIVILIMAILIGFHPSSSS